MRSLWLNIHLPQLPLEIYKAIDSEACPVVVRVGHGREQRVLLGNPVAQSLGIHPDMPMARRTAWRKVYGSGCGMKRPKDWR